MIKMEQKEEHKDFKHIVRIANTDLKGEKAIGSALRHIKGINFMFSNLISNLAKIDPKKRTGDLSEDEIKRMNDVISNPQKFNTPSWMLNRRKDSETGEDKHLISVDLTFTKDNVKCDISRDAMKYGKYKKINEKVLVEFSDLEKE